MSKIDSSMVHTAICPVCRTCHSGPQCPTDDRPRLERELLKMVKPAKKYSFDEKCLELAEHFTEGYEFVNKNDLAQAIQNAVEDFLHG